jgi:hypothetical protein
MEQQSQTRSCPQFLNNRIVQFGTKDFDGVIVSRGMDAVGKKNDFQFTNRVDPDTRTGEPEMAERFQGKPLAGERGLWEDQFIDRHLQAPVHYQVRPRFTRSVALDYL